MMTVEQMFQQIQKLPEEEKERLLDLIRGQRTPSDEDKWQKARRAIHQVAGSMDLGEQLVENLDRETIYEERFE